MNLSRTVRNLQITFDGYDKEFEAARESLKERDENMAYELQWGTGTREHWLSCGCGRVNGINRPCDEHRAMADLVRDYE